MLSQCTKVSTVVIYTDSEKAYVSVVMLEVLKVFTNCVKW